MDEQIKQGLGVAFNEASLLGIEVSRERRLAAVTLSVFTLPENDEPSPEDSRISVHLENVGRAAASLRKGLWNDPDAEVVSFPLNKLLSIVQSFKGQPIYGWEFFDRDEDFRTWSDRLSLDERFGDDGMTHSMTLFQESGSGEIAHLDVCIWFDTLKISTPKLDVLSIEDVMAGGKRWWDALFAGDKRTQDHGIGPCRPDED